MVVRPTFYDHWMLSYLTKCKIWYFIILFDISLNILASSDHREIILPPFNLSNRGELNGGKIIPL